MAVLGLIRQKWANTCPILQCLERIQLVRIIFFPYRFSNLWNTLPVNLHTAVQLISEPLVIRQLLVPHYRLELVERFDVDNTCTWVTCAVVEAVASDHNPPQNALSCIVIGVSIIHSLYTLISTTFSQVHMWKDSQHMQGCLLLSSLFTRPEYTNGTASIVIHINK